MYIGVPTRMYIFGQQTFLETIVGQLEFFITIFFTNKCKTTSKSTKIKFKKCEAKSFYTYTWSVRKQTVNAKNKLSILKLLLYFDESINIYYYYFILNYDQQAKFNLIEIESVVMLLYIFLCNLN